MFVVTFDVFSTSIQQVGELCAAVPDEIYEIFIPFFINGASTLARNVRFLFDMRI